MARGGRRLLAIGEIEPLTPRLAEAAGELLAATRLANAIDATVVASAAQRGDQVFTKDEGDLEVLAAQVDGVDVVRKRRAPPFAQRRFDLA